MIMHAERSEQQLHGFLYMSADVKQVLLLYSLQKHAQGSYKWLNLFDQAGMDMRMLRIPAPISYYNVATGEGAKRIAEVKQPACHIMH